MTRGTPPALLLAALLIAGCGGSGGGGSTDPFASNDSATTPEDQSVTVPVTANDTSVSATSVTIITAPSSGTAQSLGDGRITYTPAQDFNGSDSLTYRVTASSGSKTSSALVSITVTPVNDPPVATADTALAIAGSPVAIDVRGNDSDVDSALTSASAILGADPGHGSATASGGTITYTPTSGYSGSDSFTYRLQDDAGALSAETPVTITVLPNDQTRFTVRELPLPTENYTASFNSGVHQNVLQSEAQMFTLLPHTVSFTLHLIGDGVFGGDSQLVFSELQDPNGVVYSPLFETVQSCDTTFCNLLVPKKAEISSVPGEWTFRIATLAMDDHLTTSAGTLNLAFRTGPEPVFSDPLVAKLTINTVITGTQLTTVDVDQILAYARDLFRQNGIVAVFNPVTYLASAEFAEVSKDFNDPVTYELVTQYGDAAEANLFILDDFSDASGTLGITAAVPSSLGVVSQYNAVLVNGTGTRVGVATPEFHRRTTAQIVVHELGHYLGLNHTTEGDFASHDLITDTPECLEDTHDLDHNGLADQDECPDGLNIMFWQDNFVVQKTEFTADQQYVMDTSPIAVTAGE